MMVCKFLSLLVLPLLASEFPSPERIFSAALFSVS